MQKLIFKPSLALGAQGRANPTIAKAQLSGMLTAWRAAFGDAPQSAAQALALARGDGSTATALRAAVQALEWHPRDEITPIRLGKWLKARKGRAEADCRFEGVIDRTGVTKWFVQAVGDSACVRPVPDDVAKAEAEAEADLAQYA